MERLRKQFISLKFWTLTLASQLGLPVRTRHYLNVLCTGKIRRNAQPDLSPEEWGIFKSALNAAACTKERNTVIEWLKTVEVDGGEYITIECDEDTVAFIDSDAESVVFTKTAWRKFMADVRSGEYDV